MSILSLTLPKHIYTELTNIAQGHGVSPEAVVYGIIQQYILANRPSQDSETAQPNIAEITQALMEREHSV